MRLFEQVDAMGHEEVHFFSDPDSEYGEAAALSAQPKLPLW